jgi:hypothetical protein
MPVNILFFSQRRIAKLVAYCLAYEFEDTFVSVTDCHRIDASNAHNFNFVRRAYKFMRQISGSPKFARSLTPNPRNAIFLEHDFDLFFPVFSHSYELYSLAVIPNWRQRSKKAACFINEIGSESLPTYLIELLSEFEQIFLGTRHGVEDIARITGRPCSYLPLAVDVLRFAPSGPDQLRPIEVCNIGRRSSITHGILLERADREQSFYYYDTVAASGTGLKDRTFTVDSPQEHRRMLATLLKHSRYMIANRSHVNKPEFATAHYEISSRFYEGAAAGAIMIGEPPETDEFKRQFDWPCAVVKTPFDAVEIDHIIKDLNSDPKRLRTIQRDNVHEAALRHDWLHRIQVVFDTLDVPFTEKMRARAQRLDQIASQA